MPSKTFKAKIVREGSIFVKALKATDSIWERWQALSYTHQREHVEAIEDAKQPETRTRRIQKAIQQIRAMPARKRR
jgi:uncharacterized protein YdeI (YjbR/CyaY-like superfamily)